MKRLFAAAETLRAPPPGAADGNEASGSATEESTEEIKAAEEAQGVPA